MVKKASLLLIVLSLLFLSSPAQARHGPMEKRLGLGVFAGDPTGVTGKVYVASRYAAQATASWSLVDEGFTLLAGIIHDFFHLSLTSGTVKTPFYFGAGGKFVVNNKNTPAKGDSFGLHVPFGVSVQFLRKPFEFSFEVAPGLELAPQTELDMTGGIAARYYF